MSYRSALISFAFFLVVIIIDQLTKHLAPESWVTFNSGFIFGSMSDLPQSLRVVTLCSFGGFIFTFYIFLLAILPKQLLRLKIALGVFMGGVFGNVFDRVFLGKTIDFIPFTVFEYEVIFNLADVFQWLGAILIIYKLIKKEKIIWHPDNQRGRYLVLWHDQIYLASKIMLACLCCALLLGLFSYTFMRSLLVYHATPEELLWSYSFNFIFAFISLSLLFSVCIFAIGIYLSHRLSGPLYAFELYVEDLLKGKDRVLKLRESDQSKHLERIAADLRKHFDKKN